MRIVILLLALCGVAVAADDDWQPIAPDSGHSFTYIKSPERSLGSSHLKILNRRPSVLTRPYLKPSSSDNSLYHVAPAPESDTCSIHKVSMNQELFYQFVEYEKDIPDMKEFTLCMWSKFHNHTQDHPLFSYAVADNPKEILAWISNTAEASYFSMAVHGQVFFRLNYPLILNKWYHSCTSWNGKTGEWQIWVNAERVGRGFHNRLVDYIIKGGGSAVSGQDQSLLFKNDGLESASKQLGFMGEITMVQLYHVALTAGKAHKDHKHHHAHHFKHDGTPIEPTTEPPTEAPEPMPVPIGNGNFLVGGQLQRVPNLNLAGAQQQQMIPIQLSNGLQLQQQYINGQLGNRIVSEQLLNSVQQIQPGQPQPGQLLPVQSQSGQSQPGIPLGQISYSQLIPVGPSSASQSYGFRQSVGPSPASSLGPAKGTTVVLSGSLLNPANVQFIDDSAVHNVYRRDSKKRDKRDNPEKELEQENNNGKKDKRGLVALSDGSIVDEALLSPGINDNSADDEVFQQSLLNGLAGFDGNLPVQNEQKTTVDEREPAEAEVKAVMQVCSGCAPEPFKKALVLSWRTTAKKLHSGAHYYKGLPICRAF